MGRAGIGTQQPKFSCVGTQYYYFLILSTRLCFYKTEIDYSPLVNTQPWVAQRILILPYPSATPSWGVVGSKFFAQIKGGETYKIKSKKRKSCFYILRPYFFFFFITTLFNSFFFWITRLLFYLRPFFFFKFMLFFNSFFFVPFVLFIFLLKNKQNSKTKIKIYLFYLFFF